MIYSPAEDSFLLAEYVKKYCKNKSCLDIGTGSGILAKTALDNGASKVLATDINFESVKYAKSQGISTIKSDLFSNIKGKFDLIIFNPPYLPKDDREDSESSLATTGGRRGDEITLKFLQQAPKHLNKNGKILLLLSSLTPREKINSLLTKKRLKSRVIGKQNVFMETLYVLLIWKTQ